MGHIQDRTLSIWTNTFHPNSSDQNHIYHGSPIKLGRCSKRKPDYTTKLRKPTNGQTTNTSKKNVNAK
jgi:hypothetical protein